MKILQKMGRKLRELLRFPYDEACREQLELGVVAMNYRSERTIAYVMLLMQVFMVAVFTLRPGGIFLSQRRFSYVVSYALLLLCILVFLPFHRRSRENWRMHTRICKAFAVMLSLWTVSISYLDSLGGGSIVVYCSILPMMGAFLVISPQFMSVLFLVTCVLTDCLVLNTPFGQENLFSILINSSFICLLSMIFAHRVYRTQLSGVYDKLLIDRKNEQLEKANRELDMLSMTDALTGLGNRRYLEESVQPLLEKYGVYMGALSVMFLDIDSFKQYNDRYGHAQGDLCLQTVASILHAFAKDQDFRAVRYGGEEFVLVITGLSQDELLQRAEQLRQNVAATSIPEPLGGAAPVTISVGLAFHASWEDGLLDRAIQEADQAMYQAKQAGKNRVVMFTA